MGDSTNIGSAGTGRDRSATVVARWLRGLGFPLVVAGAVLVASSVGLAIGAGDPEPQGPPLREGELPWRTPTADDGTYRFSLTFSTTGPAASIGISAAWMIDPGSGYSLGTLRWEQPGMPEAMCEQIGLSEDECREAMAPEPLQCTVLASEEEALLQIPQIDTQDMAPAWVVVPGGEVLFLDVEALLDLDPATVSELERKGADTVKGAPSTHYFATLDFSEVFLELLGVEEDPGSETASSEFEDQMAASSRAFIENIRQEFRHTPVDLWIDDDGILRRLRVGTPLEPEELGGFIEIEIHDVGLDETLGRPSEDEISTATMGQALAHLGGDRTSLGFGEAQLPCFPI
jgi:hypothetical protein